MIEWSASWALFQFFRSLQCEIFTADNGVKTDIDMLMTAPGLLQRAVVSAHCIRVNVDKRGDDVNF